VGGLELLSVLQSQLNLAGGFWDAINFLNSGNDGRNFGYIGAGIIAIFILSWVISTVIYRVNRYDELEQRTLAASDARATLTLDPRERLD
jgi:high-affinity nickel-transport protein